MWKCTLFLNSSAPLCVYFRCISVGFGDFFFFNFFLLLLTLQWKLLVWKNIVQPVDATSMREGAHTSVTAMLIKFQIKNHFLPSVPPVKTAEFVMWNLFYCLWCMSQKEASVTSRFQVKLMKLPDKLWPQFRKALRHWHQWHLSMRLTFSMCLSAFL